jgi:hypothetical protein
MTFCNTCHILEEVRREAFCNKDMVAGDPGHGVHGERGHLVGGLHHGRDDPRRRALPRHRPHRPVEQDYRYHIIHILYIHTYIPLTLY